MCAFNWRSGIGTDYRTGQKELFPRRPKYGARTKRRGSLTREQLLKLAKPEERLQIDIIEFLRLVVPHCIVKSTINEGARNAIGHQLAVLRGLWPGWPDIDLYNFEDGKWALHVLELKVPPNILTGNQESFRRMAAERGVPRAGVTSIDDVVAALTMWGIKMREVVLARDSPRSS